MTPSERSLSFVPIEYEVSVICSHIIIYKVEGECARLIDKKKLNLIINTYFFESSGLAQAGSLVSSDL